MRLANRQYTRLHWGKPGREGPGVFFDKECHGATDRADRGAVHDKCAVRLAVLADIRKVKAVRHAKVVLYGKGRVLLAVDVLHLHVNLRAVEGGLVLGLLKLHAALLHDLAQKVLRSEE